MMHCASIVHNVTCYYKTTYSCLGVCGTSMGKEDSSFWMCPVFQILISRGYPSRKSALDALCQIEWVCYRTLMCRLSFWDGNNLVAAALSSAQISFEREPHPEAAVSLRKMVSFVT